jgi:hypothetical protein
MHRSFRSSAAWFLLALSLPVSLRAGGLEIVRILPGWHSEESFHRVSEFFGGKENTGGVTVLRSRPAELAGYYWLLRLKNADAPVPGAKFELQVISPAAPEPKTFVYPADIPAGSSLFQLGLTGGDWPGPKVNPAAWHLRLLAADGTTLLTRQSFLWELPEKNPAAGAPANPASSPVP